LVIIGFSFAQVITVIWCCSHFFTRLSLVVLGFALVIIWRSSGRFNFVIVGFPRIVALPVIV
jgi:hypothetical protein